jgi:hypothetical protein
MAKKHKSKKDEVKKMDELIYGIDFDEYHAQIMGFTSGGAAYGITWEEAKNIDENKAPENVENWMIPLEHESNEENDGEFGKNNENDDGELPF